MDGVTGLIGIVFLVGFGFTLGYLYATKIKRG